ncbi:MAG: phosphoribosyltransferase [Timaviella obliquedivisa GSE-PSE-MK23-08B]|jgi:putative phosphoribosyl transferase|nr:phosphoribosyltransferase [Timaviella obliquedivisa GSE-PSE-MK23-08B]
MKQRFHDRTEAGKLLAAQLSEYADRSDVWVLGLPRGGVPVAYEIAQALNLPLDICLVRKLGVPGQPELAMGAIAPGGVMVLNHEILESIRISRPAFQEVIESEQQELERRDRTYRENRPELDIQGKTVILVDDGIATGSTIRAAIATLRQKIPQEIVVAVPVAPISTDESLRTIVDKVVCLNLPERLNAIGMWYVDFSQTSDQEVRYLLAQQTIRTT